jgi:CBS-domain-containing membrane protein
MDSPVNERTFRVAPKVVASTVAGALTLVLVWILGLFNVEVPPEVAAALTVVLGAAAGYLRRDVDG